MSKSFENLNVKTVLMLLGLGTFLTASVLIPTLPFAVKPMIGFYHKKQREGDQKQWNQFNQSRLRQILNRLHKQKVVKIDENNGETILKLTEKGMVRFLKFKLEDMILDKHQKWDGTWRIIIYDISNHKRLTSEVFRKLLRKLEFLKLQRSVYLTPYSCTEQIEFLRQFYNIGQEVLYLEVGKIENEDTYKQYFGI